jgi:hypothetical protein
MPPAQPSHKSACFAPRRASLKVIRMIAPFASPTSVPQESHTRTVFRAILFLPCLRSPSATEGYLITASIANGILLTIHEILQPP